MIYLRTTQGNIPITTKLYDTTGNNKNGSMTQEAITKALNGKAPTSHTHTKNQITDFPTSMPASDVYPWAKAATKPSYSWSEVTGKPSTFTPASHQHHDADILDVSASKITGVIGIEHIPQGALDRLKIVKTDAQRFALTTSDVQLGDTVKVSDTGRMYYVVDESKLSSEAGYEIYTAGTATSVPWSGVTGKPDTFAPASHKHTTSDITNFPTSMKNPSSITIQLNGGSTEGTNKFTYDGSAAKTINITASMVGAAASTHSHKKADITDFPTIPTSLKNPNTLTITLNGGTTEGTNKFTYDGSAVKSLNISASSIGAAAAAHSHSYLPLSGGMLTGNLLFDTSSRTIGEPNGTKNPEIYCGNVHSNQSLLVQTNSTLVCRLGTQFGGSEVKGFLHLYNKDTLNGTSATSLIMPQSHLTKDVSLYLPSESGTLARLEDIVSSGNYLPLSGGTMTGQIKRGANGGAWISARDNAIVVGTGTSKNEWNPVISQKSEAGEWSVGNLNGTENLTFAYTTDTNYNAGTNTAIMIGLPSTKSGTIALTSDLPTWNSLKPGTTSFDGISLDSNGAYVYGQNNSGNIYFRYKDSSSANYSYTNISSLVSSINAKANASKFNDYLPLTGGTLNNFSTQCPLIITGAANNESSITFKYKTQTAGGHWVMGQGCGTSDLNSFAFYQNGTGVVARLNNDGQWRCDKLNLNHYSYVSNDLSGKYAIQFPGGSRLYFISKTPSALNFGWDTAPDKTYDEASASKQYVFRMQNTCCYCDVNFQSTGIYNNTSTGDPNVYISGETFLKRHTSASKYKLDIQDINQPDTYAYNLLKLNPKQWFDKGEVERYTDYLTMGILGEEIDDEFKVLANDGSLNPYYGLIAEDVRAAGLDDFCEYGKPDENGNKELEGIRYSKIPILMIPILRDLVSCMNKVIPYAKNRIGDETTLNEIEDIERRFNSFSDDSIVHLSYHPATGKIIQDKNESTISTQSVSSQTPNVKDKDLEIMQSLKLENEQLRKEIGAYKEEIDDKIKLLDEFKSENEELTDRCRESEMHIDALTRRFDAMKQKMDEVEMLCYSALQIGQI